MSGLAELTSAMPAPFPSALLSAEDWLQLSPLFIASPRRAACRRQAHAQPDPATQLIREYNLVCNRVVVAHESLHKDFRFDT
jgi:hypothetical protein